MRDFTFEANFETSKFCRLMLIVNNNRVRFSPCGSFISKTVTVASAPPISREVVGMEELGTAIGAFEILAGGVLVDAASYGAAFGIECSLSRNNSGSPPAVCGG